MHRSSDLPRLDLQCQFRNRKLSCSIKRHYVLFEYVSPRQYSPTATGRLSAQAFVRNPGQLAAHEEHIDSVDSSELPHFLAESNTAVDALLGFMTGELSNGNHKERHRPSPVASSTIHLNACHSPYRWKIYCCVSHPR